MACFVLRAQPRSVIVDGRSPRYFEGLPMRILSRRDVMNSVRMAEAIEAVRDAFVQLATRRAEVPVRTPIAVPKDDGLTLFMPAYLAGSASLGCKVVSVRPGNRDRGRPLIAAVVVLVDEATGEPLALMEGSYLTALRTGAGSGVATDLLARRDARVLVCFGAGAQAETQVEAALARSVRSSRVWIRSRSDETARRFASRIAGRRGVPDDVRVADDVALAARRGRCRLRKATTGAHAHLRRPLGLRRYPHQRRRLIHARDAGARRRKPSGAAASSSTPATPAWPRPAT